MIDESGRYVIEQYGKKAGFSSFLPGIAGEHGIPAWCYYVNRGQCVTSFGIQDKNHSIMEFFPAHQAYTRTKRMGFRTLVRVDGQMMEPFADENRTHIMYIGMNELELQERNDTFEIETVVSYYTLPGEDVGGLMRCVEIKNISGEKKSLEVLDGMPEVIPYGVSLDSMKDMGQTAMAWMEVQNHETGVPFFHVRASMEDTAQVVRIMGGNFGIALDETGARLLVVVDAEKIFSYDTSLERAVVFEEFGLECILKEKQITQNMLPCCFFAKKSVLQPEESVKIFEIYGQAESNEILKNFSQKVSGIQYFMQKKKEAVQLTEKITDRIAVKTGSEVFDRYCRQTFLDNVLRGGYPVELGEDKLFYLYSRKHGDIERDYNFFSMLPEFYSQGNGNFRDVNQNRRCDVQFAPFVKEQNVKTFYNCIQINGYNPLGIEKITYRSEVEGFQDSFTPGELYQYLKSVTEDGDELERRFQEILTRAECEDKTRFIEGYWTDHWTYNLDLIETFLTVYPDKEEELLFEDNSYTWLQAKEEILPREKRYVKTEQGIRQYHFLTENPQAQRTYLKDSCGNIVRATLIEKLFLISTLKTAALDVYGMGIEMEGGKPGWYDALNGLPGILGSSMCETYELARNLEFVIAELEKFQRNFSVSEEIAGLAEEINRAIEDERPDMTEGSVMEYWNRVNDAKEAYWNVTASCISGNRREIAWERAVELLKTMLKTVDYGVEKALECGGGISPAYFYYEVTHYEETERGISLKDVKMNILPPFLEGPVRHLKRNMPMKKRRNLYKKVKESELYDRKLNMYKINGSLANATFELGRCRAFTPGWLENESIWLHMEYKYLLELLKSGMYAEYLEDFQKAAVPFLEEEIYGRSLLENSSFIASSVNPNPSVHGKGFVARLSGSTAEFLQMWQIMMFGAHPFSLDEKGLKLKLEPLFPAFIIGGRQCVEATFLGSIHIVYHLCDREDFIPGTYRIEKYLVKGRDGKQETMLESIKGEEAERVRSGAVSEIEVFLSR